MQKEALAGRYGAKQGDRRTVLQVKTHDKLALVGLQGQVGAREGTRLHVDRQEKGVCVSAVGVDPACLISSIDALKLKLPQLGDLLFNGREPPGQLVYVWTLAAVHPDNRAIGGSNGDREPQQSWQRPANCASMPLGSFIPTLPSGLFGPRKEFTTFSVTIPGIEGMI